MKTRALTKDEYQLYVVAQLAAEGKETFFPLSDQDLEFGRTLYIVDEDGKISSKY